MTSSSAQERTRTQRSGTRSRTRGCGEYEYEYEYVYVYVYVYEGFPISPILVEIGIEINSCSASPSQLENATAPLRLCARLSGWEWGGAGWESGYLF
jgi:hypothetical protein